MPEGSVGQRGTGAARPVACAPPLRAVRCPVAAQVPPALTLQLTLAALRSTPGPHVLCGFPRTAAQLGQLEGAVRLAEARTLEGSTPQHHSTATTAPQRPSTTAPQHHRP